MSGRYERTLVRALGDESLPEHGPGHRRAAMRCPSSGAATSRDLPDVLAGPGLTAACGNTALTVLALPWAIELKTGKATTLYVDGEEVEALRRFCQWFGAAPVIGAYFKRPGGSRSPYYLVAPPDCRMTDSGNYGVPEADAAERAFATVYPPTDAESARIDVDEDLAATVAAEITP